MSYEYDGDLNMVVESAHELNYVMLAFLRWLYEHGYYQEDTSV